jgi:SAM-dependent methyltransferase
MTKIYEQIRSFWDSQPCGTRAVHLDPHSRDYFVEFDKFFETVYPYYFPFLDLESMRGKRVLEIGLGSGASLHRIAGVAGECYGLDLSGETIRVNQARQRHFGTRVNLVRASATDIPLPDNFFDFVVSVGCLHHIPDIQQAVDEIHRVLKPGGVIKGMVYNKNSYRYRVYIPLMMRMERRRRGQSRTRQEWVNELYDGAGNPYGMVYSRAEVTKLFRGFSDFRFKTQNFMGEELHPKWGGKIPRNLWLATLGRLVGLDLYFTARAVK